MEDASGAGPTAGPFRRRRPGAGLVTPPDQRLDELEPVLRAFGASYEALDAEDRRLLRHVGLHPDTRIDTGSAAALAGAPEADADHALRHLARAHLLRPAVPVALLTLHSAAQLWPALRSRRLRRQRPRSGRCLTRMA
ncbi:hypothetical protein ACH4VR_28460 [Streptomyces sp. NPDC020883]|uniref:hypothetical protein n=1 Tax=Streptomyces sp. NPDC020883 TaxID=3365099 RepID=UPI0037A51E81